MPVMREYHPAEIGRCPVSRYIWIRFKPIHVWTGGKDESNQESWNCATGVGSRFDFRVRTALEQRSVLHGHTNTALPYWQTAASGFNHAAAGYKVTAKVVGPEGYDAQAELAELNKAVAAKPAGILISVADAAVLQPGIDAAITAGIPVITIDSDAAGSRRPVFIGTNNLEAGQLGGKRLIEKMNGKGNLMVFTIPGQPNTEERLKGLKDALSAKPEIKIVDVSTSRVMRARHLTRPRRSWP